MISLLDYFYKTNIPNDLANQIIYNLIIIFFQFITLFFLYLTYTKLRGPALKNQKDLLLTMIGLVLFVLGEFIFSIVSFATNFEYAIFSGTDNIFIPIGFLVSITYFSRYIRTNLKINKYKKREKIYSAKMISISIVFSFIALVIMVIRFIIKPFIPLSILSDPEVVVYPLLVIVMIVVLIMIAYASFQLYRERTIVSSKLERSRLMFYLSFFGIILFSLLSLITNVLTSLSILNFNGLGFASQFFIFGSPALAIVILYYGFFMPTWLQKRLGILPSF